MPRIVHNYRRQPAERRGVLAAFLAFLLVVIFGVCAFVADIGNVIVVKSTLGAAADAAALAGAGALPHANSIPDLSYARDVAVDYGMANSPQSYGVPIDETNIQFGTWDPVALQFTETSSEPNAIRVSVERSVNRGNAVPYFFGRVLGVDETEVVAEAIAVGAVSTSSAAYDNAVYVTSSKDLSNVVLEFADGSTQKFDGLSDYSGTFAGTGEHEGKEVVGVWIKSGCNASSDGPGYGERVDNPGDGSTAHGENKSKGCTPHVTATFQATGVTFSDSGSSSPVRLVK